MIGFLFWIVAIILIFNQFISDSKLLNTRRQMVSKQDIPVYYDRKGRPYINGKKVALQRRNEHNVYVDAKSFQPIWDQTEYELNKDIIKNKNRQESKIQQAIKNDKKYIELELYCKRYKKIVHVKYDLIKEKYFFTKEREKNNQKHYYIQYLNTFYDNILMMNSTYDGFDIIEEIEINYESYISFGINRFKNGKDWW